MKYSPGIAQSESLPRDGLTLRDTAVPAEPSGLYPVHSQPAQPDKQTPAVGDFRRSDIATAVEEFHAAFNLPCQAQPSVNIEESLATLRISLLEEEIAELIAAVHARDLTGIADALADITYVTYGTALTYGINLDSVLREVHRSNMSKLDRNLRPIIRADGKVVKSERYFPPNIAAVLQDQISFAKVRNTITQ
ncbi:MAG: hypothetical protein ACRDRX_22110 [Pseudonocardiaceae bacterium]